MKKSFAKVVMTAMALASASAFGATAGDMIIEVQDLAALGSTYVADIGVPAGASVGSTSFNLGTSFSSWLTGLGTNNTDLNFMVIGGTPTAGGNITIDPTTGTPTGLANTDYNNIFTAGGSYGLLTNLLGTGQNATSAAGTPTSLNIITGSTGNIYTPISPNVYGPVASTLNLGYFTYNGSGTGTYASLGTVALNTTADTVTITTAAIPEPGTYALMAAGLLAVGAIVRRRSRA